MWAGGVLLTALMALGACVAAEPVRQCQPQLLQSSPKLSPMAAEYEDRVRQAAKALVALIEQSIADEKNAAKIARAILQSPGLAPAPLAVALGAPQVKLGILYFAATNSVIVFQRNNSKSLELYWRALAAPWNTSERVWSGAWRACGAGGWTRGVAVATGTAALRAAAALFVPLHADPCDPALHPVYGSVPLCSLETSECISTESKATTLETSLADRDGRLRYMCRCRDGLIRESQGGAVDKELSGAALEQQAADAGADVDVTFACQPCVNDTCVLPPATHKLPILYANFAAMAIVILIAIIVFKKRKCKTIALGMWTILETILAGALLLYAGSAIRFLEETPGRCLLEAWLREIGFVTCYGAVVLKLYRHLVEFRTRKAHRWIVRDVELLRVLAAMQAGAVCYMGAFTAAAWECGSACAAAARAWHVVTSASELLLLGTGVRLAYASRNANVPFQEREFLWLAIMQEMCVSACWRLLGSLYPELAPERSDVSAAVRAHASAGAALLLVFAPKLWYQWRQGRSLAQELSRRGPAEGFAGVERSEACEPSVDELRAEIKRLYVQLEVLRNKTLRAGNPHISKRRGGRKVAHRRFSLQALQARRGGRGRGAAGGGEGAEGDVSRTPEDSVCSVEGPSAFTDGAGETPGTGL